MHSYLFEYDLTRKPFATSGTKSNENPDVVGGTPPQPAEEEKKHSYRRIVPFSELLNARTE